MFSWNNSSNHESIYPIITAVVSGDTPQRALGRWVVCCASVAALAWLCWDICITIDEEVEVVWKMRWSYIKCTYFFLRYMGVCLLASSWPIGTVETPKLHFTKHDCYIWNAYQTIGSFLICLAVEYVLLLRVFALYSSHRYMKYVLPALFIAEVIIMLISVISFLPKLEYTITCATLSTPRGMFIYGATSIAFQTVLFFLTLYKFLSAVRSGWNTTPIMALLVRDGTWSFFVLMVTLTSYGLVITFANDAFNLLLYNWLISVWSFVGYRNLLNIFQLSARAESTNTTITAPHAQQFTSHLLSSQTVDEYELGILTRRES